MAQGDRRLPPVRSTGGWEAVERALDQLARATEHLDDHFGPFGPVTDWRVYRRLPPVPERRCLICGRPARYEHTGTLYAPLCAWGYRLLRRAARAGERARTAAAPPAEWLAISESVRRAAPPRCEDPDYLRIVTARFELLEDPEPLRGRKPTADAVRAWMDRADPSLKGAGGGGRIYAQFEDINRRLRLQQPHHLKWSHAREDSDALHVAARRERGELRWGDPTRPKLTPRNNP